VICKSRDSKGLVGAARHVPSFPAVLQAEADSPSLLESSLLCLIAPHVLVPERIHPSSDVGHLWQRTSDQLPSHF